ncbi:hypothetical protein [uncultured Clostridium sp.]|uniref:hypothetical protein n=1 Tax=uncultured Clostridium sp. TaxID=59620 RepID=UPI00259A2F32|nr:hypothetical protein [uncultured Clostridium sp.]
MNEKQIKIMEFAPIEMKHFTKEIFDMLEEASYSVYEESLVQQLYNSIACVLFYPAHAKEYFEKDSRRYNDAKMNWGKEREAQKMTFHLGFITSWKGQQDVNTFNMILHMMHSQYEESMELDLRAQCIEDLSYYTKFSGSFVFAKTNVLQGCVPREIRKAIEEALNPIADDVSYEITTTWNYCHLECGSSYVYQKNEKVEVSLNSLSEEAFELAVERLQAIEKNM